MSPAIKRRGMVCKGGNFDVLATRAAIIGQLLAAHISLSLATCSTDRLIVTIGAAQIAALNNTSLQPGDPRATAITRAIRSALSACGFTGPLPG